MVNHAVRAREGGSSTGTRATRGQDMVTVLLGTWLVLAVFSDGWAHFNKPELETFFTPWHGALYAGLVAVAAWIAYLGRHGLSSPQAFLRALPYGHRAAAVGVAVFGLGGAADMAWHQVFGIEVALDALLR